MIKKKKNQIQPCPDSPPIILSNKLITYSRGYLEQSGAPESIYLNAFPFQSPCFRSRLSLSRKVNRCDFKDLITNSSSEKKKKTELSGERLFFNLIWGIRFENEFISDPILVRASD